MPQLPRCPARDVFVCLGLIALFAAAPGRASANTAIQPTERTDSYAVKRRVQILERKREGHINVLFLGDSITDFWRFENPERGGRIIWDREIAPLGAANFGVSADRTQHVLWRLEQGDVEGLHPKVVVLLIGTNNTGLERDSDVPRNSVEEAIEGVKAVVRSLREKLPESHILLQAIFPRGETSADPQRAQVDQINTAIKDLADDEQVHWVDFAAQFLEPDGTLPESIMPDRLHPGARGYEIWWKAIREPLLKLLQSEPVVAGRQP